MWENAYLIIEYPKASRAHILDTSSLLRLYDSASLHWQLSASEAEVPPWQNPGFEPDEDRSREALPFPL